MDDPLGLAQRLRVDVDAMFDRVEHAIAHPSAYDLMHTQVDTELFKRFWDVWEDRLTNAELTHYRRRVYDLQRSKRERTIIL